MPDFVTEENRTFTDRPSTVFENPVKEGGFDPEFDRTFTREDGGMLGVIDRRGQSEFYWRAPDADEFVLAPREIVDDAIGANREKQTSDYRGRSTIDPLSGIAVANKVSDADTLKKFGSLGEPFSPELDPRLTPKPKATGRFQRPPIGSDPILD